MTSYAGQPQYFTFVYKKFEAQYDTLLNVYKLSIAFLMN